MTERNHLVADGAVRGLFRRWQDGKETWVVRYSIAGRARQKTLSASKASDARIQAGRILAEVQLGRDPVAEGLAETLRQREEAQAKREAVRIQKHRSFGALVDRYLEHGVGHIKPTTLKIRRSYLLEILRGLHQFDAETLARSVITAELQEIAAKRGVPTRNRVLGAFSACLGWAASEGLLERTATHGIRMLPEASRTRVLDSAELRQIWAAAGEFGDFGAIVRLLIVTGQRRSEVARLRWPEVDFATKLIRLPEQRTKNSRPHDIPMSVQVLEMLGSMERIGERLFIEPAWDRLKKQLDASVQLCLPWTLHDLRRSAVTGMADIGIQPHIIEAVVNHVSGHEAGVAGIYNRSTYAKEKRLALQAWADHLLGAGVGNVVAFGT